MRIDFSNTVIHSKYSKKLAVNDQIHSSTIDIIPYIP